MPVESEYCTAKFHCSICLSEREAGHAHMPSKKHILLARDGKETFLIPNTSQMLHFIDEIMPVASSKC